MISYLCFIHKKLGILNCFKNFKYSCKSKNEHFVMNCSIIVNHKYAFITFNKIFIIPLM